MDFQTSQQKRQGGFLDTFLQLPPRFIMQLILIILPSVNRLMQQTASSLLLSPPLPSYFPLFLSSSSTIPSFFPHSSPLFFLPSSFFFLPTLNPSHSHTLHHFSFHTFLSFYPLSLLSFNLIFPCLFSFLQINVFLFFLIYYGFPFFFQSVSFLLLFLLPSFLLSFLLPVFINFLFL